MTRWKGHNAAIVSASLIAPAPFVTGVVVEAIYDSANPANLADVSVELAYLRPILLWSAAVLVIMIAIFLFHTIRLVRASESKSAATLPLIVAGAQVLLIIIGLVAQTVISAAETM